MSQNHHDYLEKFLYSLASTDAAVFREEAGLARAKAFYATLGHPQNNYRSVHMAGTSGKGSVCIILSALLMAHGFKVGTHLSPHVLDVRERMMINLEHPNDPIIKLNLQRLKQGMDETQEPPTYFEASVGMAFSIFSDEKVDYAVIETGLGGLLDATNTIDRTDKLAVITRLGIDHTRVLGPDAASIAVHKAGIINNGNHAIILQPSTKAVQKVLTDRTEAVSASYELVKLSSSINVDQTSSGITFDALIEGQLITLTLPSHGLYQAENTQVALAALEHLAQRDGFLIQTEAIQQTLSSLSLPGRGNEKRVNHHRVIFDGAHNPQKIEGLVASIKSLTPIKPIWVFGVKQDKALESMLQSIASYANAVVFTPFMSAQAQAQIASKTAPAETLQSLWTSISRQPSYIAASPQAAFDLALQQAKPDQPIIITGSLYLVGELMSGLSNTNIHN